MNQLALPSHLSRLAGRGISDAALGGLSQGAVPYISIRSQRFTLIDAAGNKRQLDTNYMDVVIVDANPHTSKIYFDGNYDPSAVEHAPPACFSDNGVGASKQALKPQSLSCKECPHNVWGSDTSRVTGKATKACNDVKKLAVFEASNPNMIFLLRVPPATLKLLGAYIRTVQGNNAEVCMIITRITFDQVTQGVLNFAPVGWIDNAQAAAVEKIMDGKLAADLVGLNDQPFTGVIGATAAIAAPTQAAPQQIQPPPPMMQQAPAQQHGFPTMPPAPQGIPQSSPQAFMLANGQQPFATGQTAPTPASPSEAPTRKRRTKAEMEAARAAEAAALPQGAAPFAQAPPVQQERPVVNTDAPVEIPAFLRAGQPATPPQQQYGMQQSAPAPDAGLQAALTAALNLPTT